MSKDGPKNPLVEALMAFVIGLGAAVAIGTVAYCLDLESRAFWKILVMVGAITPFVFAREAWLRACRDLENFTKRKKVKEPSETLPEIDLDQEDEFDDRLGISISKVGDSDKINFTVVALDVWEKIEKMEEGESKRLMTKAFGEYVERELGKPNDDQR